jgi:release factor glutamine methyltransferase
MQATELTLSGWLRTARARLDDARSESPRAEAERLAMTVLGVRWTDLWTRLDEAIDAEPFERVLSRRLGGEPVAYIEGSAPFWDMEIACGRGVLVPRPETETLVEVGLELIASVKGPLVVDIGTGTGAVALAIASERSDAEVWATDISDEALAWARRNIESQEARLTLTKGDLFDALPSSLRGRVDLVVSNPPYIADDAELPKDVCSEPEVALRAGPTGDEILLRIVGEADASALALEVGTPEQAARIQAALGAAPETGVREDRTGRPRVVWAGV